VLISDLFKIDDQGELIQVPKVEGDALSTYAYVVDHHDHPAHDPYQCYRWGRSDFAFGQVQPGLKEAQAVYRSKHNY